MGAVVWLNGAGSGGGMKVVDVDVSAVLDSCVVVCLILVKGGS